VNFFFGGLPFALTSIYTREFGGGLKMLKNLRLRKIIRASFVKDQRSFCDENRMWENDSGPYLTQRLT
jgi:hypothetical protein